MAGLGFSPESSWLQKELIFLWPKPTAWITTTKLFEDFSRFTVRQVESPHVGGWKLSFAVTLFTCRSVSNPEQEAFVKVYKQVPHVGTEFDSHQARRAQAGEKNPRRHRCLQAFHGSTSELPASLPGTQGRASGLFRLCSWGGVYIHYIAFSKMPGLPLPE